VVRARASHTRFSELGGLRGDWIDNGPFQTADRRRTAATRRDAIRESSVGP
jgi:hypothetical protein